MNVTDAAYDTVHEYPGGSVSLAPRLGMSDAVLRGKVNPKNDRNRLAIEEADALMGKTGDFRILHALAATHGFTLLPNGVEDGPGDLMDAVLATAVAKGDLAGVIARALKDHLITPNELTKIIRACATLQAGAVSICQEATTASRQATPGKR